MDGDPERNRRANGSQETPEPVKLLFDEMLSDKLPGMLADIYPGSTHVFDIGRKSTDDRLVWEYAKHYDYIVVFSDRHRCR